MRYLWKLPPNRVRRNYMGGAGIDWFHGQQSGIDGDRPEEWIASMVEARNPGLEEILQEGYGFLDLDGRRILLKDEIAAAPEFYLGAEHCRKKGLDMGFLFKILDSSMRLHVQAHPTAEFARTYMGTPYGKLECYYILHVRPGVRPYIRLGFQHAPTKEEWRQIIERQDMDAMDGCFEPVPVEEGQVWYIPGGMPHAIGEGILMLEIMEPSDLVTRCEFEREGIVVPPEARFMGRGLDFCLNLFDYREYSVEEIRKRCSVIPYTLEKGDGYWLEQLIDETVTSCFEVKRLRVAKSVSLRGGRIQIGVVVKGTVTLQCGDVMTRLIRGDSFLIAAAADTCVFRADGGQEAEVCLVTPGQ
ncbi:MAG: mannose-6-phosphate isomerase [Eubacteriales bacterium]|nr:mannose-6-phosphate isomerase [Eubacteriales bacterium]